MELIYKVKILEMKKTVKKEVKYIRKKERRRKSSVFIHDTEFGKAGMTRENRTLKSIPSGKASGLTLTKQRA